MRNKFVFIVAAALCICMCSCAPDNHKTETEKLEKYDAYDLAAYMKPLWDGSYVYNESCMFVGSDDSSPLLFPAKEILSVRSFDLKTEYVEGKDYTFFDNKIRRTANSRIGFITEDEYYPKEPSEIQVGCNRPDKKWLLVREGDYFSSRQISVTYRRAENGHITAPTGQSSKFSRFINKLKSGQPVTMVFYGDSITAGANSSGFINCEPFAPVWAELVAYKLAADYGYDVNIVHKGHTAENDDLRALKEKGKVINFVNTAYGGMTTQWGADNLERRVNYYKPDFVAVAFGMNDPTMPAPVYAGIVEDIVDGIKNANSDADILLVSPMIPNPEAGGFSGLQPQFENELINLSQDSENVGIAPVTKIHTEILKTKRYYDMTGNNVNHPNDYLARIYAQTIMHSINA